MIRWRRLSRFHGRLNKSAKAQSMDEITQNITFESAIAAVGAAMSDASRVKILCALMDGRAWTATELSIAAEISASTTSSHLSKLVASQLITVIAQGKHRYFRLAGKEVAELIEAMMGITSNSFTSAKVSTPLHLRKARTCYDHLAGEVAVKIYDFLFQEQWITADGGMITPVGVEHFRLMGIDAQPKSSRKVCCACLDWSERRSHLGGYIGAALLTHYESKGWLTKHVGYREVTINPKCYHAFKTYFHLG